MKRPPMNCSHPGRGAEGVGSLRQRETPNGPDGHGERLDDGMTDKGTLILSHDSSFAQAVASRSQRRNPAQQHLATSPPHRENCG